MICGIDKAFSPGFITGAEPLPQPGFTFLLDLLACGSRKRMISKHSMKTRKEPPCTINSSQQDYLFQCNCNSVKMLLSWLMFTEWLILDYYFKFGKGDS